jgi:hypothetical protein
MGSRFYANNSDSIYKLLRKYRRYDNSYRIQDMRRNTPVELARYVFWRSKLDRRNDPAHARSV